MRHLKKFNESKGSDLEILKEYFTSFIDELDGICKVHFKENNANYFTITIEETRKVASKITQDSVNLIDSWIDLNNDSSKLLIELKSAISNLQDENLIDNFDLRELTNGFELEIYTKIKEDDSKNWIFVEDDYSVWIDKLRLKKYLKSKFDIEFKEAYLSEDYDKHGDSYIQLALYFQNEYPIEKLNDVINELKKIEASLNEIQMGYVIKVFSEGYCAKFKRTDNGLVMILNSSIIQVR